jgi:Chaperone of endosialidase
MTPQKLIMIHRNPSSLLLRGWVLSLFALGCFAFCPAAQAVVPPPDGGYPGGNTAEGTNALFSLTTGVFNTALGLTALFHDTDGDFNTATGAGALFSNNGDRNTAHGINALRFNTAGDSNTAMGTNALYHNTTSNTNTAVGDSALFSNTVGFGNTAVGFRALFSNTDGNFILSNNNTAVGAGALDANTTGFFNTAIGSGALGDNTTGNVNVAIGGALTNNTTGSGNVAIGGNAGLNHTTGNNNVYLGQGMSGVANESAHTYIRNINTTTVSGVGADFVTVNLSTGLLGHAASSRRYKEDIHAMDKTSEALYRLKPVTFRYKKEIDGTQSPAFGLIAEEVAEVNPGLVACNAQGQPESVHYEMVNAMLLNEFLKEHRKNEEQEARIARQQKQIDALTAGLQKVSAQLEASKPAPQMVHNP